MNFALKLVTSPDVLPVTLEEVKLHTHVDHDVEDEILEMWIRSATELAEAFQHRSNITQTWDYVLDCFPPSPFYLPRAPLQSVTHVKYYDTDGTEATFYESGSESNLIIDTDSEPGRISLAYGISWPTTVLQPISGVRIRFVAGFGASEGYAPPPVRDAIMLYVGYRNENRIADDGSVPEQFYNLLRPDRMWTP